MTDPDQFLADPRLNNGRSDWFEVLNELTSQALAQLITTPSVALLDVPTHMNVGDSLIWRGELHHLKRINVRVSYESDAADFRQEFLDGTLDDTVLLHGGGNFGDIWPKFQEFRESVVKNNHHRSFIQLPQSVYFTSRDGYRRANDVFGNHPSFLLLVRDRSSFNRVVKNMPDVRVTYLPDMALGNEDLRAPARQAASRSPLALARTDSESAGTIDIPGLRRVDWGLSGVRRIQWRSARIAGKISRAAPNSVAPVGAARIPSHAAVERRCRSPSRGSRKCGGH